MFYYFKTTSAFDTYITHPSSIIRFLTHVHAKAGCMCIDSIPQLMDYHPTSLSHPAQLFGLVGSCCLGDQYEPWKKRVFIQSNGNKITTSVPRQMSLEKGRKKKRKVEKTQFTKN